MGERPIARANAAVGLPPLYPASESRRQKVLAILARDGGHYATLVEDPNTDPVVMAVATLDGTCDLQIPGIGTTRSRSWRWWWGGILEHHVPRSAA